MMSAILLSMIVIDDCYCSSRVFQLLCFDNRVVVVVVVFNKLQCD